MGSGDRLEPLNPAFVSVTYGAGGSPASAPMRWSSDRARDEMKPAARLTCRSLERRDSRDIARLSQRGRPPYRSAPGDPPIGNDAPYEAAPDGYQSTADWWPTLGALLISKSRSVPIATAPAKPDPPSRHRNPQAEGRRRGDPGITQFSSTTPPISDFSTSLPRRGSTFRSCRASFRSRISSRRPISPAEPGRASRMAPPTGSKASRTIPPPGVWSLPPFAPSR